MWPWPVFSSMLASRVSCFKAKPKQPQAFQSWSPCRKRCGKNCSRPPWQPCWVLGDRLDIAWRSLGDRWELSVLDFLGIHWLKGIGGFEFSWFSDVLKILSYFFVHICHICFIFLMCFRSRQEKQVTAQRLDAALGNPKGESIESYQFAIFLLSESHLWFDLIA